MLYTTPNSAPLLTSSFPQHARRLAEARKRVKEKEDTRKRNKRKTNPQKREKGRTNTQKREKGKTAQGVRPSVKQDAMPSPMLLLSGLGQSLLAQALAHRILHPPDLTHPDPAYEAAYPNPVAAGPPTHQDPTSSDPVGLNLAPPDPQPTLEFCALGRGLERLVLHGFLPPASNTSLAGRVAAQSPNMVGRQAGHTMRICLPTSPDGSLTTPAMDGVTKQGSSNSSRVIVDSSAAEAGMYNTTSPGGHTTPGGFRQHGWQTSAGLWILFERSPLHGFAYVRCRNRCDCGSRESRSDRGSRKSGNYRGKDGLRNGSRVGEGGGRDVLVKAFSSSQRTHVTDVLFIWLRLSRGPRAAAEHGMGHRIDHAHGFTQLRPTDGLELRGAKGIAEGKKAGSAGYVEVPRTASPVAIGRHCSCIIEVRMPPQPQVALSKAASRRTARRAAASRSPDLESGVRVMRMDDQQSSHGERSSGASSSRQVVRPFRVAGMIVSSRAEALAAPWTRAEFGSGAQLAAEGTAPLTAEPWWEQSQRTS